MFKEDIHENIKLVTNNPILMQVKIKTIWDLN